MNQQYTLVHLTYHHEGKWLVACLHDGAEYKIKGATLSHPGYQLSGDPRAVTCPQCKKTDIHNKLLSQLPK